MTLSLSVYCFCVIIAWVMWFFANCYWQNIHSKKLFDFSFLLWLSLTLEDLTREKDWWPGITIGHKLQFSPMSMVLFYDGFVFRSEGPGGPQPPQPAQQSKRLQQTQAQVDEVWNHASQIKLWDPSNFLGAWEGGWGKNKKYQYICFPECFTQWRQTRFWCCKCPVFLDTSPVRMRYWVIYNTKLVGQCPRMNPLCWGYQWHHG